MENRMEEKMSAELAYIKNAKIILSEMRKDNER